VSTVRSRILTRDDGTEVSPDYLEAVRRDARQEAEAVMSGRLTTLAAAFSAYDKAHGRQVHDRSA
jgi:hypothetical protein